MVAAYNRGEIGDAPTGTSASPRALQRDDPDERGRDEVGREVGQPDLDQFGPGTPSVSIRIMAWSRAPRKSRALPPPVTSSRSWMKSPDSVAGRPFTGAKRTSATV